MNKSDPIVMLADQLLTQFIPRDKNLTAFSFGFTVIPDQTYQVFYEKSITGKKETWKLTSYVEVKKDNH